MNILFLSVHGALEYDLMVSWRRLGYNIFFLQADFNNKGRPQIYPRVQGGVREYGICDDLASDVHRKWGQIINDNYVSSVELPKELFDKTDVFYSMSRHRISGYFLDRGLKVIHHLVGQTGQGEISESKKLIDRGGIVVSYWDTEKNMFSDYADKVNLIYFGKDSREFSGWTGNEKRVMYACNSPERGCCFLEIAQQVIGDLPHIGIGKDTEVFGGESGRKTYDELKAEMRKNRVMFYIGTRPAPYTLSLIEGMMTGIPIVAYDRGDRTSDISHIIEHGKSGFVSSNIDELKKYIDLLLNDDILAKSMSKEIRKRALELFDIDNTTLKWKELFEKVK